MSLRPYFSDRFSREFWNSCRNWRSMEPKLCLLWIIGKLHIIKSILSNYNQHNYAYPISASNSCSRLSPRNDHSFILQAVNIENFKLLSTVQCLYRHNRKSFSKLILSDVRTSVSFVLFCNRVTCACKLPASKTYWVLSILQKSICSVNEIIASHRRSLSSLFNFHARSNNTIAL